MVSVIIPTFNRAIFLTKALRSVFEQCYRPLQLIVVDDGSEDNTHSVIESFRSEVKPDDTFFFENYYQENKGAQHARNYGISKVNGSFIKFMDSDDLLSPDVISNQVDCIKDKKDFIVYGPWFYVDKNDTKINGVRQETPLDIDPLDAHLRGWFCPPHTYLWPREVVAKNGPWDVDLVADQDGEYVMRALVNGFKLLYCPKSAALYRMHDDAEQTSGIQSMAHYESRLSVCNKMASLLSDRDVFGQYKNSLAHRSYQLERATCLLYPDLAKKCRAFSRDLCGVKKPEITGGFSYKICRSFFGLYISEWISLQKRRLLKLRVSR